MGVGELVEEGTDEGHIERAAGKLPFEPLRIPGSPIALSAPQDPSGKDSVEERLHQCGAKEVVTLLTGELEAEGLLELGTQQGQRRQLLLLFEPQARGACVTCQKPGDVFGIGQRRRGEHDALEKLREALAGFCGELPRGVAMRPELDLAARQTTRLELGDGTGGRVAADQDEVAQVGHKDESVTFDVALDLLGIRPLRTVEYVVRGALDFDYTAGGWLATQRFDVVCMGELLLDKQAEVGRARTQVLELRHRPDFRLETAADLVEQGGQGAVVAGLGHTPA